MIYFTNIMITSKKCVVTLGEMKYEIYLDIVKPQSLLVVRENLMEI